MEHKDGRRDGTEGKSALVGEVCAQEHRANACIDALIRRGIPPERLLATCRTDAATGAAGRAAGTALSARSIRKVPIARQITINPMAKRALIMAGGAGGVKAFMGRQGG